MRFYPRTSYNCHALQVLEYDRAREIVAAHADSEEGRAYISAVFPASDSTEVSGLLREVDEFMTALRFDDAVPSTAVHNIRKLFTLFRIEGYNLGTENIVAVADNLECARRIREYFEERAEKYPVLWDIAQFLTCHDDIEQRIRKVITPDLSIADDASPELRSIRRKLAQARNSLRNLVEKTLASLPDDIVADRIITIRNGRFVIPVRDSMKNRVAGAVHDRSQTGKTLFIEPMASIEENNCVSELEMAEQAEVQRILVELSGLIASAADDVELNQDTLVRLDVIKAKARYGVVVDGVVTEVSDEPVLHISKGRHPLLDWKFRKAGEGVTVVPIDIEIGGSSLTIVITGPNAGGKTVALKTVGILTAMALSGFPVPAGPGTRVFPPSGFFADIGDEQSIENDLSTFSSHMRQIVTIVEEANSGSLVLLDELGGGTNPSDGEAIALAVLRKLTGDEALTLATTHHEGLKIFAHETDRVLNASLEFDNEYLRPTFVFRTGVPGSSYAFEIAARIGMPEKILKDAQSNAGSERKSLEGLITEMEGHMRAADEDRKKALAERRKLETARSEYEQKRDDITMRKQEMLKEALAESREIVEDANRRIELSIREIREKNAARETIKEATSRVDNLKKDLQKLASRVPKRKKKKARKSITKLTEGAAVWVGSLDTAAVVEEVLDNGRKARIRIGKSKASLVVQVSDLYEHDDLKKPEQVVRVNIRSPNISSNEIDLRGMTFDEARETLDVFLDRLHVSGIETAHIIHGKGSGVLRKKIGKYLSDHSYVDAFRLGNWNEGSTGVTVVTLKR